MCSRLTPLRYQTAPLADCSPVLAATDGQISALPATCCLARAAIGQRVYSRRRQTCSPVPRSPYGAPRDVADVLQMEPPRLPPARLLAMDGFIHNVLRCPTQCSVAIEFVVVVDVDVVVARTSRSPRPIRHTSAPIFMPSPQEIASPRHSIPPADSNWAGRDRRRGRTPRKG